MTAPEKYHRPKCWRVMGGCLIVAICVAWLLASYLAANRADEAGWTPLMHLAKGDGNIREARRLLLRGARVDAESVSGDTALLVACIAGRNHELVELLIEHGADVNVNDRLAYTPLRSAIHSGGRDRIQIIECLIRNGATVSDRLRKEAEEIGGSSLVALLDGSGAAPKKQETE